MNPSKYKPFPSIKLPDRSWPDKTITEAPIWCSVDLRDGNQALINPMSIDQKMQLFERLVKIGFKEIEVGFPAASETEFNFLRKLIEENHIPEDVTIQVLTQCRKTLIEKTFQAIKGSKNTIIHLYNSTSELQRRVVFKKSKQEIIDLAVNGATWVKELIPTVPETKIRLQYSPESFTGTEVSFAVKVCQAVCEIWKPTPQNKVTLNLPSSVEMYQPNIFADQIEWFGKNIKKRDSVIISLHNHNDRGTATAATELGLLAGAERVEGTLFGNGERTGNTDLVTVALNMLTQGIQPNLDFSDINAIIECTNDCTKIPVPPRHPYAGELVFTAFSGSHQDAINKGFKAYKNSDKKTWAIPYFTIDPQDLGRSYDGIVRINSQSGKGGIAYILKNMYGINLTREKQVELSKKVQTFSEETGREVLAEDVFRIYNQETLQEI